MSRKRQLEDKEGESAKKKAKLAASPGGDRASKPDLSKAWTRTDPITGETGRLQRKDAAYRKHLARRKNHMTKKKSGGKAKEKEKEKEEVKTDAKDEQDYADLTARFDGHVVIVTGGGEGLGQAVALRLAKEGAIVYILDKKKWKDTEKLCSNNVLRADQVLGEGMRCDVTDSKDVKKCVEQIIEKHGYIDVVVNAAVLHEGEAVILDKLKSTDLDKSLETNLKGAINVCQLVLPYMQAEMYGRVVNLVSVTGVKPSPGQLVGASISAGVIAATRAIAKEYANSGVTVNCVAYSFVDTETGSETQEYLKRAAKETAIGRAAELAEVAGTVAWAACEENSYTTGFVYDCTGGLL